MVFPVNVVNQRVILMNQRVLVVSIPGSCVRIGFVRVSVLTAPAGPSRPITGFETARGTCEVGSRCGDLGVQDVKSRPVTIA